jgi:DNA-binding LacI/PurR family transcriptional regulator
MLVSRINADNLNQVLEPFDSGRAIGIIVIGQWTHHDQLNAMIAYKPIVVWGAKMPNQEYVSIGSDNIRGGFLATEHLLKQKCKRIAFFGDKALPEVSQRYEGYLMAHQQYKVTVDEKLCIPSPFSADTVETDITNLATNSITFDGIFACSDLIAMRAIGTLQKLKISVPKEVSIVGYDDVVLASYFHPAISTIKQSIETGARTLVKSLFNIINDEKVASQQLEVNLVVRESSLR